MTSKTFARKITENGSLLVMVSLMALMLISIAGLVLCLTNDGVFASTPGSGPYYVKEHMAGPTLKCSVHEKFFDRGRYQVQWQRYNRGRLRYISISDQLHDSVHFEMVGDASAGVYDLRIKHVAQDAVAGSYYCTVLDRQATEQYQVEPVDVIVLVPPGDPVITESPSQAVTDGDSVSFKCTSSGGSPHPLISWIFLNGSTADTKHVSTHFRESETESILHFRVRSEDNGAYVLCTVTSKAIEFEPPKETRSPRLNVLFKPRVRVFPDQDIAVESGSQIDLVCDADSNPFPPSYEWRHLALGEVYASSKWTITASRNMTGDFECRASNSVGEGSAILALNVYYSPIVTTKVFPFFKARLNLKEGERVDVECTVDANPQAVNVKWTGPHGFLSEGPILVLKSVSRNQSGNYTCLATNYLNIYGETGSKTRTGSAVTVIDIQRPPGQAEITSQGLSINVGENITLTCFTRDLGSPPGSYKWATPTSGGIFVTREHDRAQLIVRNAQLADNGRYRCRADNSQGKGKEAAVHVTVVQAASISRHPPKEQLLKAEQHTSFLECEAKGYPAPTFNWFKDGKEIDKQRYKIKTVIVKSSCAPGVYCSQTVTSTLLFAEPLKWADKGNYSCEATNGAAHNSAEDTSWTLVRVNHGPVILNQRFPDEGFAAAELGTMAHIRCTVSARPQPKSFTWMFDSVPVKEDGRYSFQVTQRYDYDEYEHVLQISDVVESDYGSYMCRVTNGIGKAEVIIRLAQAGAPHVPTGLHKISSSPNSLLVGWIPAFDGGFEQSFVIEYRSADTLAEGLVNESVFTVETKNTSRIEHIKDDGSVTWFLSYNLTGLDPLSSYYFRLRSKNKMGFSDFSQPVAATTSDIVEDPNMLAPAFLRYDPLQNSLTVEPPPPSDDCTLLYVSSGESWRSLSCFATAQKIPVLPKGTLLRARFCSRENRLRCSKMSSIFEASSPTSRWILALVISLTLLALIVVLVCVSMVYCCRTETTVKARRNGTTALSTMPQSETKNTTIRGSQADSGVSTLDSNKLKAWLPFYSCSSVENRTVVENWAAEQCDFAKKPCNNVSTNPGLHRGLLSQRDEGSVSGAEDDGGRRVIREIIV